LYANKISNTHATCNIHFILPDVTNLVSYDKRYRLERFSLCSLLKSHGTSPS